MFIDVYGLNLRCILKGVEHEKVSKENMRLNNVKVSQFHKYKIHINLIVILKVALKAKFLVHYVFKIYNTDINRHFCVYHLRPFTLPYLSLNGIAVSFLNFILHN
jgi:hypothetical protein